MAYGKYARPFDEEGAPPRVRRAERLVDMMDEQGNSALRASLREEGVAEFDPSEKSSARASVGGTCKRGAERPVERPAERPVGHPTSLPAILSVTAEGAGETMTVVLALPREDGANEGGKPRRVRVSLLPEQYADLRAEGIAMTAGGLSPEQAEALLAAGALCDAIRRGLGLLQYGDRSARRLASGLIAKGVARDTAEEAAAYLARKGYIREADTALLRAGQNVRKGWGPRRIREDLRAHGFEGDAVEQAMESLEDVDFVDACAAVIRKKYSSISFTGSGRDERTPERQNDLRKMTAALMRLGYDMEHIRGAVRRLSRE